MYTTSGFVAGGCALALRAIERGKGGDARKRQDQERERTLHANLQKNMVAPARAITYLIAEKSAGRRTRIPPSS